MPFFIGLSVGIKLRSILYSLFSILYSLFSILYILYHFSIFSLLAIVVRHWAYLT
ncbi:TPA: hypothetical protein ACKRII_003061 [Proteus mirabilis]